MRTAPAQRVSPKNALKLSAWIASQHPELFRQLLGKVTALQRSPLGRLGYFGDDAAVADLTFTPDLPPIEIASGVDFQSSAAYTPDLTPVADFSNADTLALTDASLPADIFSNALESAPTPDSSAPPAAGSFWSSIGSGLSGAASAIGKVASGLLSPGAIAGVGGAAAAYFTLKGKTAASNAQNAVLQTQLARTAAGHSPAAISYIRDPTTGQVIPVYNTPRGPTPVTGSLLNTLANPSMAGTVAGIPTTYLLIGGGLLLLTAVLSARK